MKKNLIVLIIIAMTASLAGMISIQGYWIKNALLLQERHFTGSVGKLGESVVDKLQLHEQQKRVKQRKNSEAVFNKIDSLNSIIYIGKHGRFELNILQGPNGLKLEDTVIYDEQHYYEASLEEKIDPYTKFLIKERDNLLADIRKNPEIISDVLGSDFSFPNFQPIENRIDTNILDSLISDELTKRGITTSCEYAIFDPSRRFLILQKTGNYPTKLLNSPFRFLLYPSNPFKTREVLLLYFPQERKFLLNNIQRLLYISLFILLVITSSFSYMVHLVLRQRKLSELKSDFINNMTHEFKTPISTISLACEAMNDPDISSSEALVKNYINIIAEENNRLRVMAENILQSASVENVKLQIRPEIINIETIIADAVKKVYMQVETRNGTIETDFQTTNPELSADKIHITNMIFNLLDNANKYSLDTPKIVVTTKNQKNWIVITVEDNGIGISKSNQKKIFEKLFRISTGNIHDVKGFGLGLAYVKAIVELHKGYTEIESEVKKGTKFYVYLPVR